MFYRGHKPLPVEELKETPPSPPPPVVDEAPPPAPPPSFLPTPTITSGRFKADMTKYSSKQAPGKVKGQPKLTKPDLSPFEGAVPTLSSSSLLASPPKPVVFTPIRLASHSSAINYIISQINSGDQEACVQALKQVRHAHTHTHTYTHTHSHTHSHTHTYTTHTLTHTHTHSHSFTHTHCTWLCLTDH